MKLFKVTNTLAYLPERRRRRKTVFLASAPERVDVGPVLLLLLGEVDERREGQDGDGDQHHQESEFLVGLRRQDNVAF
jgi:hypothetical protein